MSTTTVVSARVDTATLRRAMRVIDVSNVTLADIIKAEIAHIAETGEITLEQRLAQEEAARCEEGRRKMAKFMEWRKEALRVEWLSTLTDAEMKDMIASRYV